jgi:hypothetical protein
VEGFAVKGSDLTGCENFVPEFSGAWSHYVIERFPARSFVHLLLTESVLFFAAPAASRGGT